MGMEKFTQNTINLFYHIQIRKSISEQSFFLNAIFVYFNFFQLKKMIKNIQNLIGNREKINT